ncbi:heme-binding protein A [Actinobacillus equuli]|nr:heme-binding protein A [Actinobacillus equuli]
MVQYEFDLVKAKKLLAEAGYPNGFETEIWVQPVVRPSNPNPRRTAEIIQADWAKIGVKAKLVSHEWADFNKRTREGEFSAGTYGWTSRNGDPDNFLFPLLSKEIFRVPIIHVGRITNLKAYYKKRYKHKIPLNVSSYINKRSKFSKKYTDNSDCACD